MYEPRRLGDRALQGEYGLCRPRAAPSGRQRATGPDELFLPLGALSHGKAAVSTVGEASECMDQLDSP